MLVEGATDGVGTLVITGPLLWKSPLNSCQLSYFPRKRWQCGALMVWFLRLIKLSNKQYICRWLEMHPTIHTNYELLIIVFCYWFSYLGILVWISYKTSQIGMLVLFCPIGKQLVCFQLHFPPMYIMAYIISQKMYQYWIEYLCQSMFLQQINRILQKPCAKVLNRNP